MKIVLTGESTIMTVGPDIGDLLISDAHATSGLVVRDAVTRRVVGGPFDTLQTAVVAALRLTDQAVWLEHLDDRARPVGSALRISRRKRL